MTFAVLVARLGLNEAAHRFGVSAKTLRRWLREGEPSFRYQPIVAGVLKRHLRSAKAAETRRVKAQASLGIEPPAESELPDADVLPSKLPSDSKAYRDIERKEGVEPGSVQEIESTRNEGQIHWVHIGDDVRSVSAEDLLGIVLDIWRPSQRHYMQVKFLFFRYIPFNPLYRGGLAKLQGSWVEWWAQTGAWSAEYSMRNNIEGILEYALLAAETRIIYLETIGVSVFDHVLPKIDIRQPIR